MVTPYETSYYKRHRYAKQFSWAIPNQNTIKELVKLSPIVEIGAGTGYWANLLSKQGAEVVAYDAKPPKKRGFNSYCKQSNYPVRLGRENKVKKHPHHTLMLCWAPYGEPMAYNALKKYKGDTLIYIGEGWGGCCADDDFWELVKREWVVVCHHHIEKWDGIRDFCAVYKRKGV